MNEGIFTIELGRYGFMLDTQWAYVSLSWELLAIAGLVAIGYKVYTKIKTSKPAPTVIVDDNDDWLTK